MGRNRTRNLGWLLPVLLLLPACEPEDLLAQIPDAGPELTVLAYHDGTAEESTAPDNQAAHAQIAVRFTPPTYPATIEQVQFFVADRGIPDTAFAVRVYDDDGADQRPGTDLLSTPVEDSAAVGGTYVVVNLSEHALVIEEGDFFVAMEWLTVIASGPENCQYLGMDRSNPDGRSYWSGPEESDWRPIDNIDGGGDRDAMISATVSHMAD